MIITPQALQDRIHAKNAPAVRRAVDKLNATLERTAEETGDVTKASATLSIGGDVNRLVAEKVVQEFIQAGWDAKTVYDQRDGNYIQVTYKAPFRQKRVIPMTPERTGYEGMGDWINR